jgi:hypothetical protein
MTVKRFVILYLYYAGIAGTIWWMGVSLWGALNPPPTNWEIIKGHAEQIQKNNTRMIFNN